MRTFCLAAVQLCSIAFLANCTLAAVGKAANHAEQMHLYLAPLHGKVKVIKVQIVNIRKAVAHPP